MGAPLEADSNWPLLYPEGQVGFVKALVLSTSPHPIGDGLTHMG